MHPVWTPAAADWLERCIGQGGSTERIFAGLITGTACDMAIRGGIDPLPLALNVYRDLQVCEPGELLRWAWELERRNRKIVAAWQEQAVAELEARRAAAPRRTAAPGTRRPAGKRKRKARR